MTAAFTDEELQKLLMRAVYKECIFNKPEVLRVALDSFPEGAPSAEEFAGYIGVEKMRLIMEFAESVGAIAIGMDLGEPDKIGEPAGSC